MTESMRNLSFCYYFAFVLVCFGLVLSFCSSHWNTQYFGAVFYVRIYLFMLQFQLFGVVIRAFTIHVTQHHRWTMQRRSDGRSIGHMCVSYISYHKEQTNYAKANVRFSYWQTMLAHNNNTVWISFVSVFRCVFGFFLFLALALAVILPTNCAR